ncbi:glycosyl transferase, partial [Bifidobacterium aemilianum]
HCSLPPHPSRVFSALASGALLPPLVLCFSLRPAYGFSLGLVASLAYPDIDLYRYYPRRDRQSVQTSVMISRVDQLLTVNRLMVEATPERGSVPDGLYRYMIHYLSINCVVTSVFLILSKRPENYRAKQSLWKRMNDYSPTVSHDVRHTFLCRLINMPGKPGRLAIRLGYRIAEAAVGLN